MSIGLTSCHAVVRINVRRPVIRLARHTGTFGKLNNRRQVPPAKEYEDKSADEAFHRYRTTVTKDFSSHPAGSACTVQQKGSSAEIVGKFKGQKAGPDDPAAPRR